MGGGSGIRRRVKEKENKQKIQGAGSVGKQKVSRWREGHTCQRKQEQSIKRNGSQKAKKIREEDKRKKKVQYKRQET